MEGELEPGITIMEERIALWKDTGTFLGQTGMLTRIAEAYGMANRSQKAIELLHQALTLVDVTQERVSEAEIYLCEGRILWEHAQDELSEQAAKKIEYHFEKAIALAQNQRARYWELIAATDLSQLYAELGMLDEAHRRLATIFEWFTEGFDYSHVRHAHQLLQQLNLMQSERGTSTQPCKQSRL